MYRIVFRRKTRFLFAVCMVGVCVYTLFLFVKLRVREPVTSSTVLRTRLNSEDIVEILTNSLVEANVSVEGVKGLQEYYYARRFNDQGEQLYRHSQTSISYNMTKMRERYKDRRHHLKNACTMLSMTTIRRITPDVDLEANIWIQQKHGLAICTIPKIGSTFWRRVLKVLDWSNPKIKSPFVLVYNDNVSPLSMKDVLAKNKNLTLKNVIHKMKSIMYVREPYGRLFSAYIDKLFTPNPSFFKDIGMYTIANFRNNPSPASLRCGHDVKFSEVVKYFIFTETNRTNRNIHFIPVHEQCEPCGVEYEIIAKMETFQEDTYHILHRIGALNRVVKFDDFRSEYEIDSIIDQIGLVFRTMAQLKDCLSLDQILRRLWRKFIITGILDKTQKYPLFEDESGNVTMSQFSALVVGSHRLSNRSRRRNKLEALRQAYSQVGKEDLDHLQKVLMKDLLLFGYDVHPKKIFQSDEKFKETENYFDYFDII